MTSITHRIAALFRIKADKALDNAGDPREVLGYSYEQQLQMLQRVRRGVADVATSRKRVEPAADAGDEAVFTVALSALLDAVRSLGRSLPDETITPSGLVLPDEDAGLTQVRELLSDEGLIPG